MTTDQFGEFMFIAVSDEPQRLLKHDPVCHGVSAGTCVRWQKGRYDAKHIIGYAEHSARNGQQVKVRLKVRFGTSETTEEKKGTAMKDGKCPHGMSSPAWCKKCKQAEGKPTPAPAAAQTTATTKTLMDSYMEAVSQTKPSFPTVGQFGAAMLVPMAKYVVVMLKTDRAAVKLTLDPDHWNVNYQSTVVVNDPFILVAQQSSTWHGVCTMCRSAYNEGASVCKVSFRATGNVLSSKSKEPWLCMTCVAVFVTNVFGGTIKVAQSPAARKNADSSTSAILNGIADQYTQAFDRHKPKPFTLGKQDNK